MVCKITFPRVSHIQRVNDYKPYPHQSINNLEKPVAKMRNNFRISHSKHFLGTQKIRPSETTPLSTQNTFEDSLHKTECEWVSL